jgi:hypothetical protein
MDKIKELLKNNPEITAEWAAKLIEILEADGRDPIIVLRELLTASKRDLELIQDATGVELPELYEDPEIDPATPVPQALSKPGGMGSWMS